MFTYLMKNERTNEWSVLDRRTAARTLRFINTVAKYGYTYKLHIL